MKQQSCDGLHFRSHRPEEKSIYWIHGDDSWLKNQCHQTLLTFAQQTGYTTRERFDIARGAESLAGFTSACSNQSLFATQTIVDLYNPGAKFDEKSKNTMIFGIINGRV